MKAFVLATVMLAAVILATPTGATPATDYAHDNTRGLLETTYVSQYQQQQAIYQSSPVNLIVPTFKNVTFAFAGANYNIKMQSSDFGQSSPGTNAVQTLKISGYTLAPYIAVSLHRIGLGFSGERGTRKVQYSLFQSNQPSNVAVPFATHQLSNMEYTAVGVYVYLLPFESTGDRKILASLLFGAKTYSVSHYVSPIMPANEPLTQQKITYNLTQYEIGSLVEYRLLKKFAIVPWIDYNYIDIHDPINQADAIINQNSSAGGNYDTAYCLKGDTFMFWRARPQLNLGLDLVVTIFDVTVHMGDALGYLVSNRNNKTITDTSYTVSLSVNMKAD